MNWNYLASASIGLLLGSSAGALAAPVGPNAGYKIDPEHTSTSPDGTTTIDQLAGLAKGTDENYRSMGVTWPDSRYLVIGLSGEVHSNSRHGQILSVGDWHCRYDLKTGKFDVPPDFRGEQCQGNCSRLRIKVSSINRLEARHNRFDARSRPRSARRRYEPPISPIPLRVGCRFVDCGSGRRPANSGAGHGAQQFRWLRPRDERLWA
jgi:hypothetical protein